MDDNELDKLFGEVSEAASKPAKETSGDSEKESSKKEDPDSASSAEELRENGFIVKNYEDDAGSDEDEVENDDSEDDKTSDDEETEDESDLESEDIEESEEESEESEEAEDGEESEDEEEESEASEKPAPKKPAKKKAEKRLLLESFTLSKRSITIIALLLVIIGFAALIYFLPAFRVRNVHVEGNISLTDQQILRELKLEYNDHLMGGVSGNILDVIRLDYGKTEERIKRENPYIEDIRVSVKLPSTVDVTVRERRKVCYIRTPDGYAALDKDGIVLELSSFDANKRVRPVISGLTVKGAELGKPVKLGNTNDYKKAIIVLGAILAADNASVGDTYSMFENTSELRILPSGYMFLTVYSPAGKLVQVKLNSLEKISDNMAWLLYAFNSEALDKTKTKGFLDMTGDDPTLREY
ncbi:POTRA domain-containing FtsQ-type protein [Ruminococcaceae bacterium R-25]|nr:POTRA domain-containing FtsQ-type protein [Ruminococcaceae bacterium R-25]SUQ11910.1 POTRA domain-containing protein, FtsQ-type [Oscillospiraceae bacterium]